MTLYILEWDNGLQYGDREETLLGIYESNDDRELAKARYARYPTTQWPFSGSSRRSSGSFKCWEIELGTDLIVKYSLQPD